MGSYCQRKGWNDHMHMASYPVVLLIPALDALMDSLNLGWISTLINIVLAFVLARILTQLTGKVLQKTYKRRALRFAHDDTAARRIETGVTLCQGIAKYVFYFIAVAISIGELGLTSAMASMLAAAGIGTLAIGIGAQSLIGDITSGFFMLFEDELAVGDYVLVAGVEGIVEEVTLRTVTVRGFRGEKNIIPGSFATPEAIAHIMTQKFVMGSPLYRQEQEINRQGIQLSRQTMSNWILKVTEDYLTPVYKQLHKELLKRDVLHGDETTLQVLHEPGKAPQSESYMWLYRTSGDTDKPIVLYEYQPGRGAKHPKEFLAGYKGYLHTDGYQGYHSLPEDITVVGCWAHARRKFDEAVKSLPKGKAKASSASQGLAYCNLLFEIEQGLAEKTAEERYNERLKQAKPVLDAMFAWANSKTAAPKSALGKAFTYLNEQWPYLTNYLKDGRLELSNNRAERSIKPFVIDRKNFLFANTPKGAKGSAIMFSLIQTAIENGLDPYQYLTWLLKNTNKADLKNPDMPEKLLPWNAPAGCRTK